MFQLRRILFVPSITFLLSPACFCRFLFGTLRPHCALGPIRLPAPWPNLPRDPSTSEGSSEQLDSGLIPCDPSEGQQVICPKTHRSSGRTRTRNPSLQTLIKSSLSHLILRPAHQFIFPGLQTPPRTMTQPQKH